MPILIANALVSIAILLAGANVPASWLNVSKYFIHHNLGATFTTITSANTISSFPTTYNANLTLTPNLTTANTFTALQTLANSSTTLATIGTEWLTTLNLTTALPTISGGTGSTTLASNQVLLGNGTGNVGIVSGFGTSGQFLTSQGNGVAPIWQTGAIDQTANYTWTGLHIFNTAGIIVTASSTLNSRVNLAASDTSTHALCLNGICYQFPSTQTASSTFLATNGSGSLSWETPTSTLAMGIMTATSTTGGATSGNNDAVQTVGFQPSFIKINYYLLGHTTSAGTNVLNEQKGTATYNGVGTLIYNDVLYNTTNTGGSITVGSFNNSNSPVDNGGQPVAGQGGGAGSGAIQAALSVPSVTSTGFTIRCAFASQGGNTGSCNATWEAYR